MVVVVRQMVARVQVVVQAVMQPTPEQIQQAVLVLGRMVLVLVEAECKSREIQQQQERGLQTQVMVVLHHTVLVVLVVQVIA